MSEYRSFGRGRNEQGRDRVVLPLTTSLSNRWEVQVQVQTEAQVRWVLGTPQRLSLVQRGQAWVLCPEVSWALFHTNHPLEGFGPKLCTNLQGEPAKKVSGQAENPLALRERTNRGFICMLSFLFP